MNQRNASNAHRTVKINVTFPLPMVQGEEPAKQTCTDCSSGGKCEKSKNPLLGAGETLLDMAGGHYTLEQLAAALEIIETLLKRHYSKR